MRPQNPSREPAGPLSDMSMAAAHSRIASASGSGRAFIPSGLSQVVRSEPVAGSGPDASFWANSIARHGARPPGSGALAMSPLQSSDARSRETESDRRAAWRTAIAFRRMRSSRSGDRGCSITRLHNRSLFVFLLATRGRTRSVANTKSLLQPWQSASPRRPFRTLCWR